MIYFPIYHFENRKNKTYLQSQPDDIELPHLMDGFHFNIV